MSRGGEGQRSVDAGKDAVPDRRAQADVAFVSLPECTASALEADATRDRTQRRASLGNDANDANKWERREQHRLGPASRWRRRAPQLIWKTASRAPIG